MGSGDPIGANGYLVRRTAVRLLDRVHGFVSRPRVEVVLKSYSLSAADIVASIHVKPPLEFDMLSWAAAAVIVLPIVTTVVATIRMIVSTTGKLDRAYVPAVVRRVTNALCVANAAFCIAGVALVAPRPNDGLLGAAMLSGAVGLAGNRAAVSQLVRHALRGGRKRPAGAHAKPGRRGR